MEAQAFRILRATFALRLALRMSLRRRSFLVSPLLSAVGSPLALPSRGYQATINPQSSSNSGSSARRNSVQCRRRGKGGDAHDERNLYLCTRILHGGGDSADGSDESVAIRLLSWYHVAAVDLPFVHHSLSRFEPIRLAARQGAKFRAPVVDGGARESTTRR